MEKSRREIIAENVSKFMGEKSILEVAYETKISQTYLRQIRSAKANLSLDVIERLAKYFGVTEAELMGYELHPAPIIEHKLVIGGKPLYGENVENFIPVPLLADPASLGSGLEINENNVEGTCLIHSRALKKGGNYQAIFVRGNSMIPVLEDGDIVAVDVKERDPQKLKKKLVACHCGDFQVTVKQLLILKDKFYFKAFNPKWEEENMPILTSQKEGLILGKVVWAWKKFE
jgi:SOS-response transcriptional repressor LexA